MRALDKVKIGTFGDKTGKGCMIIVGRKVIRLYTADMEQAHEVAFLLGDTLKSVSVGAVIGKLENDEMNGGIHAPVSTTENIRGRGTVKHDWIGRKV